ncbi:MAG: MauE/DoxX family redox-associated membrane protein [Planctomycetota bacterium]
MALLWVELPVGVCLVGGICPRGVLLSCVLMASRFTFVIASALYGGLDVSCGCFGSHAAVISYSTLIHACAILVFSIAAYVGLVLAKGDNGPGNTSLASAMKRTRRG